TNLPEIQALCRSVFAAFFAKNPEKKYTVRSVSLVSAFDVRPYPQSHTETLFPDVFFFSLFSKTVQGRTSNAKPFGPYATCPHPTHRAMRSRRPRRRVGRSRNISPR